MRAARWLRRFSEWRWAPCVGLLIGAFAFIALVLLLIPNQFNAASAPLPVARSLDTHFAPNVALFAASPAPPRVVPEPQPEAPAAPLPVVSDAPPAVPPDYAANNADRADRPGAGVVPR